MSSQQHPLVASILLGLLWGLWHLPVIDYLGSATPHRSWWLGFTFAFIAAMTAMRVLICWLYSHTKSVLLAQLLHISSTGSLVIFSAHGVTPAQEVLWYSLYAATLWIIVAAIAKRFPMCES
jgi:membrane protease YdiL (CAAX protease family)